MRSENTVKEPDNQTSQRFIRETACAPNHGKYVLWWYTHVRVYCSQISEVNPTLADFNVYLLFLLTRREEVSQAAQKAPHAPIVFFLIQQFVERTEELENWLGEADEIIRYQRLGKKKKKKKCWMTNVDLKEDSSEDLSFSHLKKLLHWYSGFFLALTLGPLERQDCR